LRRTGSQRAEEFYDDLVLWLVPLLSGAVQEEPLQQSAFLEVAQAGRLKAMMTTARRRETDFM
jgi:hypothetical protein